MKLEKSTITLSTGLSIVLFLIGGAVNFLSTRYAIQLELQQQRNDLEKAVLQANNRNDMQDQRIAMVEGSIAENKDNIRSIVSFIGAGLKPDAPSLQRRK